MYGVVGVFSMDEEQAERQQKALEAVIVPGVRAHEGFVSGYWARNHEGGTSHTLILFDTEEQARSFRETVEKNTRMQGSSGVGIQSLTIVEVVAQADRSD